MELAPFFWTLVVTASCASSSTSSGVVTKPDSGSGAASCAATFDAFCQKSCDCGRGKCRVVSVNDGGGGGGGAVTFDTSRQCTDFYAARGCEGGGRTFGTSACADAVAASTCTSAPLDGVVTPPACVAGSSDAGTD